MKFPDLLIMSINNLRRRKLRTVLTVLGVVIGTASIVVMVSLGIGLNQLTMEQIASFGSLTKIDVSSDSRWNQDSSDKKTQPNYITDDVIASLGRLEYVKSVSPVLSVNVILKQGAYQAQSSLKGVSYEALQEIPLKEGKTPEPSDKKLEMVVGNMVPTMFSNAKSGKGYWDTGEVPDVDFMNSSMFVIFDTDAYYASQGTSGGDDAQAVKPPKKYIVPVAGMVEGSLEEWNNYSYDIYVEVGELEAQLKRIFKKKPIPNQPTTKKGKSLGYIVYDSAEVYVDSMDHVAEVQKAVSDLGYQANSNMDWLKQSQQQTNMVQAVLGGIGAVSLVVAAIGIANTMMMSIYERTREIGVMKVLGCDMKNIRNMFLLESGFIGFLGGVAGVLLSLLVSLLINKLANGAAILGVSGNLSQIPLWLNLGAIGFAVLVGMAAGFMPATRAMRLSPLAAIRNE